MNSQHLKRRLVDAIAIIADCERFLENIDYAATGWSGVELQGRVADFMDRHRDDVASGCAL